MKESIKLILFIQLTLVLSCKLAGQDLQMFRTIYYPANPYGGEEELKLFIKQEIVYPEEALNEEKEGSVFIKYIVNSEGKVIYKEIVSDAEEAFQKEASRVFDKILWEDDNSRDDGGLGYEEMKITFHPKKYKKIAKKRGYDRLPLVELPLDSTYRTFTINDLDVKPDIKNGSSLNQFISDNIVYPAIALQRGITGRVTVKFVIEPYGKASNIRIVEPLAGGCNEETMRLIRSIDWIPGVKNDKAVRTLYTYQLNFVHPGNTVR